MKNSIKKKVLGLNNGLKLCKASLKKIITSLSVQDNGSEVDEIMRGHISGLSNISVEKLSEDTKFPNIKLFKPLITKRFARKFKGGFSDSFLLGFKTYSNGGKGIKQIVGSTKFKRRFLEVLENNGKNMSNPKSIALAVNTLIGEDTRDKYRAVRHIQIMVWDGILESPSGSVLFIEQILDRIKVVLLVKKPVTLTEFEYSLYDMDTASSILSEENGFAEIDTDIFSWLGSYKRRYTINELEDTIHRWESIPKRYELIEKEVKTETIK